jgi:hypothetical protein
MIEYSFSRHTMRGRILRAETLRLIAMQPALATCAYDKISSHSDEEFPKQ